MDCSSQQRNSNRNGRDAQEEPALPSFNIAAKTKGNRASVLGMNYVLGNPFVNVSPRAFLICQSQDISAKTIIALIVIVLIIAGGTIGGIMGSRVGGKGPSSDLTSSTDSNGDVLVTDNKTSTHGNETGTFDISKTPGYDFFNPKSMVAQYVRFAQSFAKAPTIAIGLVQINVSPGSDTVGLSAYTDQRSGEGFMMHVDSVGGSQVHTARLQWLAVPPEITSNTTQYQAGHASTLQSRARGSSHDNTTLHVAFPYKFDVAPSVIVWIDGVEMASKKGTGGWRLHTYASDIAVSGFTIHIDTWNDTELYVGNASWVAVSGASTNTMTSSLRTSNVQPLDASNYTWGEVVHADWPDAMKTNKAPTVLAAFGMFDIDNNSLLRFSALDANATADGINMEIAGFQQTRFRDGEVPYIAVF